MEEIDNLITGCFVHRQEYNITENDSEEDEDGDEMTWLGYSEVSSVNMGKSFVQYEKPTRTKGDMIDLYTGKMQKVCGTFHLVGQWWQTTMLRTKHSARDRCREIKDVYAMCYRLRDDSNRFKHNVLALFLNEVKNSCHYGDDFLHQQLDFEDYLKSSNQLDSTDLANLEERLTAFVDYFNDEEKKKEALKFKNNIVDSYQFIPVQVALKHPHLLHYLPQLFPFNFKKLITLNGNRLQALEKLLDENPGFLAFKPVMAKKCGILGCETSFEALTKSGLMQKVPQEVQDAVHMYEFLKKETKNYGHTCIYFDKMLAALSSVVSMFEEALEFLNKHKVTKTQMEGGYRMVYLMSLWQAENRIAAGINSLLSQNELTPWKLEVDWDAEHLQTICKDNDQLRAAKLITEHPVVAISGKGGCGKTHVVTKVITSAKQMKKENAAGDKTLNNQTKPVDDCMDTQPPAVDDGLGDKMENDDWLDCYNHGDGGVDDSEKAPKIIELLLTAPTGKAANLLGKRAGRQSCTLHQVIFSHRMLKPGQEWKHKNVNILVVDECSLVSVSTFSYLIQLLIDEAQLRRIVLLGDIRQLPSIEPGNFLEDTFIALSKIGCAVELRTNHRAESQIIVDNATRISKKGYPQFHEEKFVLRKLPPIDYNGPNKDYYAQDIDQEVMRLLQDPALASDVNSQFISFTRKICDSINDHCCKKYSNHRTMENRKRVFRTNDKICCSKNGYVKIYEDIHGLMSCKKRKEKNKKDKDNKDDTSLIDTTDGHSDGGMNRFLDDSEKLDTDNQQDSEGAKNDQPEEENQIRLCNGEIFFIMDEVERQDDQGDMRTFLLLSDKDPDKEFQFWVDKNQIRKACKLRHAWARTIHTFQGSETDNVVYIVGGPSRFQTWQHVYTAITRGRKSVFILGDEGILHMAIKKSEIKRQTSLRKQLVERFQKRHNFIGTQVTKEAQTPTLATTSSTSPLKDMLTSPAKPQSPKPGLNRGGNSKARCRLSLTALRNKDKSRQSVLAADNPDQNTTQMMTDILTSLAEDHEEADIEEYISDDGEEPLPQNKHPTDPTMSVISASVTENIDGKRRPGDSAKDISDDIDDAEIESDDSDSQSLLYTPDVLKPSNFRNFSDNTFQGSNDSKGDTNKTSNGFTTIKPLHRDSDHNDNHELNECSTVDLTYESDVEIANEDNSDSEDSQSLLVPPSVQKSKPLSSQNDMRKSLRSLSQIGFISNSQGSSSVNGKDVIKTTSTVTPNVGNRYTSQAARMEQHLQFGWASVGTPGTPWMNYKLSDFQKTSSPLDIDRMANSHFHIHTGVSPLTPACGAPILKHPNLSLNSSYFAPSPTGNDFKTSATDNIQEPKSNESQWSEIDENELLKLNESATPATQNGKSNIATFSGNTSSNISHSGSKHLLDRSGARQALVTNVSTNSLWSDVGDENYLGLSLDDISNMADKYQPQNTSTSSTISGAENRSVHSDFGHKRGKDRLRGRYYLKDESTSPDVTSSSTTSFLHSSTSSGASPVNQSCSPGVKRLCARKEVSPKRPYMQDTSNTVSPLKHSLARLDFTSP